MSARDAQWCNIAYSVEQGPNPLGVCAHLAAVLPFSVVAACATSGAGLAHPADNQPDEAQTVRRMAGSWRVLAQQGGQRKRSKATTALASACFHEWIICVGPAMHAPCSPV